VTTSQKQFSVSNEGATIAIRINTAFHKCAQTFGVHISACLTYSFLQILNFEEAVFAAVYLTKMHKRKNVLQKCT
jgi:hypothetical protein